MKYIAHVDISFIRQGGLYTRSTRLLR